MQGSSSLFGSIFGRASEQPDVRAIRIQLIVCRKDKFASIACRKLEYPTDAHGVSGFGFSRFHFGAQATEDAAAVVDGHGSPVSGVLKGNRLGRANVRRRPCILPA